METNNKQVWEDMRVYHYVLSVEINGIEVESKDVGTDLTKAIFSKVCKKEEFVNNEKGNILRSYDEVTPTDMDINTLEIAHSLYLCEGGRFVDIILTAYPKENE